MKGRAECAVAKNLVFSDGCASVGVAMRNLLFLFCLIALAGAGCATAPERTAGYTVVCIQDAFFEAEGAGHDAKSGGVWLSGNGGGTLRLDPPAPEVGGGRLPVGDLVLNIRTRAGAGQGIGIKLLRVATPAQVFTYYPTGSFVVSSHDDASRVEELRGMDYIRVSREGGRVRVVLTGRFLQRYAPDGASVAWFEP
ncbi:MAG: hypothetical protein LBV28_02085 [Puniceicoccales bacterium]|jgi:hypothetical protein|nr:hypothetical protein [Puniceicoccales bacterium]